MIRWLIVAAILCGSGCSKQAPSEVALETMRAEAAEMAQDLAGEPITSQAPIVVRLSFNSDVDLDLYVTDPLLDTVYFARHESRAGGVISSDVRCDTSGPRVEEVQFEKLWPGHYRVGVDFPRRCDGSRTPAVTPYAVTVNANGELHSASGLVNLEFFEVVVLEFEVEEGES